MGSIAKKIEYLPILEANTRPKPQARGPPILRNFSFGAQTAIADRPENNLIKNHKNDTTKHI